MPLSKWKVIAKVVLLILIVDLLVSAVWLTRVLILEADQELYPAEVGIVLMGDSADHYRALGKQTRQRLNHAVELYRQGFFKEFLCVGGFRPVSNYSGAELMRQYLLNKGIPADKITLEALSYDTMTNLSFAAEILRKKKWLRVVLISSPLHIHRIRVLGDDRFLHGRFVFFAPHSFLQADPGLNLWEMWKAIHYEWMSYAVRTLPQATYEQVVRRLRGQGA